MGIEKHITGEENSVSIEENGEMKWFRNDKGKWYKKGGGGEWKVGNKKDCF
jgi:hypothetical protein